MKSAEQHGLLPLLALKFHKVDDISIPEILRHELQTSQRTYAALSLALTGEMFRLVNRLTTMNIETLVTKGPVLSQRCYGDPGARQYSDLDLIARTRDMRYCTEIMMELGYEPRIPLRAIAEGKLPGEYAFRRQGTDVLVELHTEHTFRYHPRRLPLDKVFARKTHVAFGDQQIPALSPEDELVLICIHSAKHLWERLAWVADVAALLAQTRDFDWQRAMSAAREVGAERMLRVGVLVTSSLLELSLPREIESYMKVDEAAVRFAKGIALRLSSNVPANLGIVGRAAYRVKMRGGFFPGLAYLLRLSLSPTEDDWSATDKASRGFWLFDAVRRPLRLARKYKQQTVK